MRSIKNPRTFHHHLLGSREAPELMRSIENPRVHSTITALGPIREWTVEEASRIRARLIITALGREALGDEKLKSEASRTCASERCRELLTRVERGSAHLTLRIKL